MLSMKRPALIVALWLLTGVAVASTFELSDPANEIYQEKQAPEEPEPSLEPSGNILCTIDTGTGECSCIDQEQAKKLTLTRDECVERVRRSLNLREP
jgi:hypothetical protein